MKKINFCLVFTNQLSTDLVGKVLINKGIAAHHVDHPDQVLAVLEKREIDFLFLDFDFANKASFNLLTGLRQNEKYASIYIIGTSFATNRQLIKQMQENNVLTFMTKPLEPKSLSHKIDQILQKFKESFPDRHHLRIKPEKDELMRLSFRLKNHRYISGKILDISIGGAAVLLYTNYESNDLSAGTLIEHLNFEANHKEIDVDGKIINKKEKFIAFKFTHYYYDSYKDLMRYIIKKINA